MSQRDPATRPASRRTSTSSAITTETGNRPVGQPTGGHDAPTDAIKWPPRESSGRGQQVAPKSLGMLNILNPSDSRPRDLHGTHELPTQGVQTPSTFSSWAQGASRQPGPSHSASASYPGTPVGNPSLAQSRSERQSPTVGYPFPNMSEPRPVLSPKAPRSSSLSQGSGLPREFDTRAHGYAPLVSPAKRPYESDSADEPRLPPNLHQTPRAANASSIHVSSPPPRSLSRAANIAPEIPSQDAPGRPPHPHFQHVHPPGQPSNLNRPQEGPSWSEMMRRSGMGSGSGGMDGQQAYMTLPGSDTPIPVQVDYSQASKKADEKRQRNAKASTRHRRKKKTLQEENVRQLQELKDERQQMSDEIDHLRRQRDFYRDERNRLRDLVSRTPGIHQHAPGPRSPTPTRSIGSHTDHSPISQHLMPTPMQGYAGDSVSADRALQRLRMEERTEFTGPGLPSGVPSAGLALPHGQPFSVPPRPPSAASSGSGERLPPLRAMEEPPGTVQHMGSGQAHEQDPRTGQWRPVPSRQVETGWATGPRKSTDGQIHPW